MGFIDYDGTKKDRYEDVLKLVKTHREEEAKRQEIKRISSWLNKSLGNPTFEELTVNELLKYVIIRYRQLEALKDKMLEAYGQERIDCELFWKDFSIATVVKQLEPFKLPLEKQKAYYNTFMEKVFRLEDFTSGEDHYFGIENDKYYRQYFAACFDLACEKQFWKWIGRIGSGCEKENVSFIDAYQQLTALMGYYLFKTLKPKDMDWLSRLEGEQVILEKIRQNYKAGRFKEVNYFKLKNPMYAVHAPETLQDDTKAAESKTETGASETLYEPKEPIRPKYPQLDKDDFYQLLEDKKLSSYVDACRLLRKCQLSADIDEIYQDMILRMPVLQESIDKFEHVYQPDMYSFYEYYIPETLQLTATLLEYREAGISKEIFGEAEKDVIEAGRKLVLAVNGKIDEIYKFGSIEIKAQARALEDIMTQDGYVNSDLKLK